ncbi:MAG: TetR/AcrR family transcriptional regulator [Rhizomicrobium sp.]
MQKRVTPRAGRLAKKSRPAPPKVRLEMNGPPLQDRSRSTYDAILRSAGEILVEVGIERLSTNLVCKRAGLTPPALYRYFPNKYSLLKELGARLMTVQDKAVFAWQDRYGSAWPASVGGMAKARQAILRDVDRITKTFPGGGWIMRALRAVPTLSAVRIASREQVAERDFAALVERYPDADRKTLRVAATLCVEVMHATLELVVDQPELDGDLFLREISYMTALYVASFAKPRVKK